MFLVEGEKKFKGEKREKPGIQSRRDVGKVHVRRVFCVKICCCYLVLFDRDSGLCEKEVMDKVSETFGKAKRPVPPLGSPPSSNLCQHP